MLEYSRKLYLKKRREMLLNVFISKFIKILNGGLFVALLMMIGVLIIVIIKDDNQIVVCSTEFDFVLILKSALGVLTLLIASLQVSRYLSQLAIDSVTKLRDVFDRDKMKNIQHGLMMGLQPKDRDIDIYNFLGYIEVGSIMLQRALISKEDFNNQFEFILKIVLQNTELRDHIKDSSKYYSDLLFVIYLSDQKICNLV